MSKQIGIVICNYNKKEFVIPCIQSVLDSTIDNFDVYVVDNASTDGSAQAIRETYADRVTLVENAENLGGSGGFNSGLRAALKDKYDYYMCVDNDILMDKDNVEKLFEFLETHTEVGIVGSKICRMSNPERLQELGAALDFENCSNEPYFKDYLDNDELPEIQYCDYVPACSLMIRGNVLEEIGLMPEDNFIYWDDMEWCYKAKLAGYEVVAYRDARVEHAMGMGNGTNYFQAYYFWRNRIRFFQKYAPDNKKEATIETLLEKMFQILYGCYYKGKKNQMQVMMHALDDAVQGRGGKAKEGIILPKDVIENRLEKILSLKRKVYIECNGDNKLLQEILKCAQNATAMPDIVLVSEQDEDVRKQNPGYEIISKPAEPLENDAICLCMCEHVSKINDMSLKKVYIDSYNNLLENERDVQHFSGYTYNKDLFVSMWKVLLME